MRDTLAGLVHMLVQEHFITNTSHPPLRMMIRKVVAYVHGNVFPPKYGRAIDTQCFDPAQLDENSMTYLFGVISLGFLANILDPRTYRFWKDESGPTPREEALNIEYDVNAMPATERRGCIWTRGVAVELADWFCDNYDLISCKPGYVPTKGSANLVYHSIAHEAFGVYVASKRVEGVPERQGLHAYGATSDNIRDQLECLDNHSIVEQKIKRYLEDFDEGKMPTEFNILFDWSDWTCRRKQHSSNFRQMTQQEIIGWGRTSLDELYIRGEECKFRLSST